MGNVIRKKGVSKVVFTVKKSVPLLMISLMMLFIVSACTQINGPSQQPELNQEKAQVETNIPEPSNEPSPSVLPADVQEEAVTFDPVVLFELTDEDLSKPETEIPYYSFGNIGYVNQEEIQGFAEGHYPWRGDSVQAAEILTQNLIPEGVSSEQVNYSVVRVENKLQTDELTVVDMTVPDLGTFTIHLQYPKENGVFSFITKIVWQPESSESLQQLEGSVTFFNLYEEEWFDKPTSEIPAYNKGSIGYFEQEAVDSHNRGSSVPWSDPLVQALIRMANLVPMEYLPDPAIDEQLGKPISKDDVRKIVTSNDVEFILLKNEKSEDHEIVEVKVPDFGKFTVTMMRSKSPDTGITFIQKIVFQGNDLK